MEITPQDLALSGYYIFPCRGKKARVKWRDQSTTDIAVIRAWEKQFPGCTWAIDCGRSGITVLDDDRGKDPDAVYSFLALELDHGVLPPTYTVKTQSGGYHYYFRGQGRNSASSRLGKGLDSRGSGGYVMAPCCPGYEVIAALPVAPAPLWFLELIGRPLEREPREVPADVTLDTEGAIARAIEYLQDADPAIEGAGGDAHTYDVACRVRDFGISQATCLELLLDNWNDLCSPPWDPEDLEKKVANAYQYAQTPIASRSPENVFSVVEEDPKESRFKLLRSADVKLLPRMTWVVKGLIPARGLFQVYGPSTSGKSFWLFDILAAIAEGRPWNGRRTKQRPVLLVSLEGEAGLRQRLEAWEKHNGRTLPDNFQMMCEPWLIVRKQDVLDLAAKVPEGAVVVIDTQNRAAPMADESASKDMGAIIEGALLLSRTIGGVVGLAAHTGKDVTKGARGHSSQLPAMDAQIEMSRDGEIRTWRAVKVKDGVDGATGAFLLKEITLDDVDEDGEPITSCVVDFDGARSFLTEEDVLGKNEAAVWQAMLFLSSESPNGLVANHRLKAELAVQLGEEQSRKTDKKCSAAAKKLEQMSWLGKRDGMWTITRLIAVENAE